MIERCKRARGGRGVRARRCEPRTEQESNEWHGGNKAEVLAADSSTDEEVGTHTGNVLDSSDDEVDEGLFEIALISGMRIAPAPTPEQLECKHEATKELKEKIILYNWVGLGWCVGRIRRPNGDKSKLVKVDGDRRPAHFMIGYSTVLNIRKRVPGDSQPFSKNDAQKRAKSSHFF